MDYVWCRQKQNELTITRVCFHVVETRQGFHVDDTLYKTEQVTGHYCLRGRYVIYQFCFRVKW